MFWIRGKYKHHTSAGDQTRILGHSAHILVKQPTEISLKTICFGLASLVILLAFSNRFENFECLMNLAVSQSSTGFLFIYDLKAYKSRILHLQLKFIKLHVRSRGSVTGVATTLRSGRSGPRILVEARDFPLLPNVHTLGNTRFSFLWVKWSGREVKNSRSSSPPSSTNVKSKQRYSSVVPVCLREVDKENFTFCFRFEWKT